MWLKSMQEYVKKYNSCRLFVCHTAIFLNRTRWKYSGNLVKTPIINIHQNVKVNTK